MSVTPESAPAALPRRGSGWLRLLGWAMASFVRIKREAAGTGASRIDPARPVCYLLERSSLSNLLILEQATRELNLPSPIDPMPGGQLRKRRAVLALSRRPGWFRRPRSLGQSDGLAQLIEAARLDPALDVQLIPVSIFVGRAPDRQTGWFSVLFSENWAVVGRFRRLLAVLLNGRDTIVQFSEPVSLRGVLAEDLTPERTLRKVARVLRAHFRRVRAAIIGPDLSHRRTVVDAVLNADAVRAAISAAASKQNIPPDQARGQARAYALEIAADYSHPVVRSASFLLTGFWNKIYGGVELRHFESLQQIAPGHEVIYVPSHRSHIDYLLLSYLLYSNGVVPPHIAAGVNLNLPLLGPLLRRGGAFFLRRSFRANALYSAVFGEYVSQLFQRGVSMEYFIEGGRSRTGRLLAPRAGLLVMTVRAFLRESRRPVVFQPVYIGYEKLMEGRSYIGELTGKPKPKESLLNLLRSSLAMLRQRYGRVAVSFGEPILLDDLLDGFAPSWREDAAKQDVRPEWFNAAVAELAKRIQENTNSAADVNPINLLALALLATPKHALGEADLIAQIEITRALLTELPYSDRVTITKLSAPEIIAYGEQMQTIQRVAHPLGDVLHAAGDSAVLLSYFRNNVLHLCATAAWIACCFLNNRRMARASVLRLARIVYPFIQQELFLPWSEDDFVTRVQSTIEFFVNRGLLGTDADGRVLTRGRGQSDSAFQLRTIAHSLLQAFERYYIALAVLVKNGPGTLSSGELENLCHLTAQRLSLLHELNAPEFFDRSLFRGFIQKLKERRVVWNNANGKLDFDHNLTEVAKDAKVILSRELRHSILKLTPESRGESTTLPAAPAEE